MKTKLLIKSLLVAAGLLMGMNAWADSKVSFYSNDFSAANSLDLISVSASANQTLSLATDANAKYDQYVKQETQDRTRDVYMTVSSLLSASYADYKDYTIEFDAAFRSGSTNRTGGNSLTLKSTGTTDIFKMATPSTQVGTTGNLVFTVTGADAEKTITLKPSTWYHFKFEITESAVAYTVTLGSDNTSVTNGSGSLTITDSRINQIYFGTARNYGQTWFDNIDIYSMASGDVANDPTILMTGVKGENREYTITFGEGETLHYTVPEGTEQTATQSPLVITVSAAGTLSAYTTKGTATSSTKEATVTHGAITLNAPVFNVVGIEQGTDGFYYPTVSFSCDNINLEGSPTATFDKTSPYTFTATGDFTVTASAEGYTSSSNTFTVSQAYINSNTIDFGALTAADFDDAIWTSGTGAPRDYWTQRAAAIPADVTYYGWKTLSITNGDDVNNVNKASLNGITISNPHQRTAQVYIGYGLLAPYDPTKVDGTAAATASNNLNFTVNGATSDDYVVYNGWNNYGNGTFNTVLAGDATFGLYRYDTMLRTINVFSPAPATVPVAVADGKEFATFNSDYALDFANVTDIIAYTAQVSADGSTVTMTKVDGAVPANTGLLIRKAASTSAEVPVAASAAAVTNEFIAVTADNCDEGQEYKTVKEGFILATVGGEQGFYKANSTDGTKVGKGKAYLPATGAAGARLTVKFGDEATGISDMRVVTVDNAVYNLNGVRVSQPTKGLYIVNGKKMVIK